MEERRQYPRFACAIPLHLSLQNKPGSFPLMAIDVSYNGLRVKGKALGLAVSPENLVHIMLEKQPDFKHFGFAGEVVHYSMDEENLIFGIHILQIDAAAQTRWNNIVSAVRQKSALK